MSAAELASNREKSGIGEDLQVKVCAVIPVYRHVQFVWKVYQQLKHHKLHCFIVNDGNSPHDSNKLHAMFESETQATVVDQYPNGGKGMASYKGFCAARDAGFTHALQVDADGQQGFRKLLHSIDDAKKPRPEARQSDREEVCPRQERT